MTSRSISGSKDHTAVKKDAAWKHIVAFLVWLELSNVIGGLLFRFVTTPFLPTSSEVSEWLLYGVAGAAFLLVVQFFCAVIVYGFFKTLSPNKARTAYVFVGVVGAYVLHVSMYGDLRSAGIEANNAEKLAAAVSIPVLIAAFLLIASFMLFLRRQPRLPDDTTNLRGE